MASIASAPRPTAADLPSPSSRAGLGAARGGRHGQRSAAMSLGAHRHDAHEGLLHDHGHLDILLLLLDPLLFGDARIGLLCGRRVRLARPIVVVVELVDLLAVVGLEVTRLARAGLHLAAGQGLVPVLAAAAPAGEATSAKAAEEPRTPTLGILVGRGHPPRQELRLRGEGDHRVVPGPGPEQHQVDLDDADPQLWHLHELLLQLLPGVRARPRRVRHLVVPRLVPVEGALATPLDVRRREDNRGPVRAGLRDLGLGRRGTEVRQSAHSVDAEVVLLADRQQALLARIHGMHPTHACAFLIWVGEEQRVHAVEA
mmetsp:Transcript_120886/g.347272  ORF Transcript_120886/g.347272 Transcript_120886/m.347272 type:complete len:314 (+) Transcript_120886:355-1296(+)